MFEIIKFILLLSLGFIVAKLCFSFVLALFTFTLAGFMMTGSILLLLSISGIMESDTAWFIVKCAMGIGLLCDVLKFIKGPGEVFSQTKEIFDTPLDTGDSYHSGCSQQEPDQRFSSDKYRKCCGSCRWFSSNISHYSICGLSGNEMSHDDSCEDWQLG